MLTYSRRPVGNRRCIYSRCLKVTSTRQRVIPQQLNQAILLVCSGHMRVTKPRTISNIVRGFVTHLDGVGYLQERLTQKSLKQF